MKRSTNTSVRNGAAGPITPAGRRGAKPPDRNSSAHIGLYYISKWATEEATQEFARTYADALPKRYESLRHVTDQGNVPGLNRYNSSDGLIFIQQTGNAVVAVESFDEDSAKKLIEAGLKRVGNRSRVSFFKRISRTESILLPPWWQPQDYVWYRTKKGAVSWGAKV